MVILLLNSHSNFTFTTYGNCAAKRFSFILYEVTFFYSTQKCLCNEYLNIFRHSWPFQALICHSKTISTCYRPQTKFPKVMFLHVSVCPWGAVCSRGGLLLGGVCSRGGGVSAPRGVCSWGGSPGPHSGGSPGPHPGGSPGPHLGGVSRPTPRGVSAPPWWQLLLRVVRILLECILVCIFNCRLPDDRLILALRLSMRNLVGCVSSNIHTLVERQRSSSTLQSSCW